jgi:hypothetical protein
VFVTAPPAVRFPVKVKEPELFNVLIVAAGSVRELALSMVIFGAVVTL